MFYLNDGIKEEKDEELEHVLEVVKSYDCILLRKVLDDIKRSTLKNSNLLHGLIIASSKPDSRNDILKDIIYMLVDAGVDTEVKNKSGDTCLFESVLRNNVELSDILLQCGADMWANTTNFKLCEDLHCMFVMHVFILFIIKRPFMLKNWQKFFNYILKNVSIHEYVFIASSEAMQEIFRKYSPGLWKAVEEEDIYQCRKLVNLWCRTNLHQNGVSLKDVAIKTGNEDIITLILGIHCTMELIYAVFANNVARAQKIMETHSKRIRLDLRKMSERGAPILYYVIQRQDLQMIQLFMKHGCPIYSIMYDEQGCNMPVLFSALGAPASVIEELLPPDKPHQEEILYKILYKGYTILEMAVLRGVSLECFNVLVDRGGPRLLCERNQGNFSIQELALAVEKPEYINIIDMNVHSWIQHPERYPGRRDKLALYGWNLEHVEKEIEDASCDTFFLIRALQCTVMILAGCIEMGNYELFQIYCQSLKDCGASENFLWHGRVEGDGMPLLHKAVLHKRRSMVEHILQQQPPGESVDNLFDQHRRTALHYAYASASTRDITLLLSSYGCSDHVLDKANKEPLDFKEKQDTPSMLQLLDKLRTTVHGYIDIDPWVEDEPSATTHPCCHPAIENTDSSCESMSEEEDDDQGNNSCLIM